MLDILTTKDFYTALHCQRFGKLTRLFTPQLRIAGIEIYTALLAASYHDVDKVGIENAVLNKPDHLDKLEHRYICKHPTIGMELLRTCLPEKRMA